MAFREDQLNGRIATIIREGIAGTQWVVVEEKDSSLVGTQKRPDIRIMRPLPEPPIVIENEYIKGNVEIDCLDKLGRQLRPEYGGQTIHTVIGILTPPSLQNVANGDDAEAMLRYGVTLEYIAYMGSPTAYTRFPKAGFIKGNIRNLMEFMRPAAEPADLIRQAADTLGQRRRRRCRLHNRISRNGTRNRRGDS